MAIFRGTRLEHEKIEHFHCGKPKWPKMTPPDFHNFWGPKWPKLRIARTFFAASWRKVGRRGLFAFFDYFWAQLKLRTRALLSWGSVSASADRRPSIMAIDGRFSLVFRALFGWKRGHGGSTFSGKVDIFGYFRKSQRCIEFSFKTPKNCPQCHRNHFWPPFLAILLRASRWSRASFLAIFGSKNGTLSLRFSILALNSALGPEGHWFLKTVALEGFTETVVKIKIFTAVSANPRGSLLLTLKSPKTLLQKFYHENFLVENFCKSWPAIFGHFSQPF